MWIDCGGVRRLTESMDEAEGSRGMRGVKGVKGGMVRLTESIDEGSWWG